MTSLTPLERWMEGREVSSALVWSRPPPTSLAAPPWRVPAATPRAKDINRLLEFSLQLQSSTLQTQMKTADELELVELRYYILSNSALTVAGLMSRYLTAIGVDNTAVCGVYKPTVTDYAGLKGVPTVFLKIGEQKIDNTYLHQTEKASQKKNVKDFYAIMPAIRTSKAYLEELPSKTEVAMVTKKELGEEVDAQAEYLEACCASKASLTNHLATLLHHGELHPGVVLFDLAMRKFLKEEFGVEVGGLVEEVEGRCWGCGLARDKLSLCSGCQFARYCGKECIAKDWVGMHKMMHKVTRAFASRLQERKLSVAKLQI